MNITTRRSYCQFGVHAKAHVFTLYIKPGVNTWLILKIELPSKIHQEKAYLQCSSK